MNTDTGSYVPPESKMTTDELIEALTREADRRKAVIDAKYAGTGFDTSTAHTLMIRLLREAAVRLSNCEE